MKILPIDHPNFSSKSYGKKAASLAHLQKLGLLVPPSWVLCQQSLLELLPIEELRRSATHCDRYPSEYERKHRELSQSLASLSCPELLFGPLNSILADNPSVSRWIVRSNHSCEDGRLHSFAGTFLSLVVNANRESLWEGIRSVVLQALSFEAQYQVLSTGVNPMDFLPGVLLQPFVEAKQSGVYFSRNPESPWEKTALCEWVEGGAKELVDGDVSASRERLPLGESPGISPLREVHTQGRQIAEAFGCSIDGEWLWDGTQVIWVQARPIGDPLSQVADRIHPDCILSREDMKERFPEPLSRMGWSVLEKIINSNLRSLDVQFGLCVPPTDELVVNHLGTIYSNREFFQLQGVKWKKSYALRLLRPAKLCGIALQFFRQPRLDVLTLRLKDLFLETPLTEICQHWSSTEKGVNLQAITESVNGNNECLANGFRKLEEVSQEVFANDMATFVLREVYYAGLKQVLGSDDAVQRLLNKERVANQQLYQDCESLKALLRGPECRAFLELLQQGSIRPKLLPGTVRIHWDAFIERWGSMNDSWDVMKPAWQEDPRRLYSFLTGPMGPQEAQQDSSIQEESRLRKLGLDEILSKFIEIVKTDDREHYFGAQILAAARKLLLEAGRRLARLGVLTDPQQVFGLTVDEARQALSSPPSYSLAPFATAHLQILERSREQLIPDFLNRPEPRLAPSDQFLGVPVSAGRVKGQLRFIRSNKDLEDLQPDDILALVSPNPAYIPFFTKVKGIVCETGGLLSHSFVVARELLLPAVTQVKGLGQRFENGDAVVIDGSTGQIEKVVGDD